MLMLGGLLVCSGLLAFASLIPVFRRLAPPRWTTRWGVGEAVSVIIVSFVTIGIGCLGAGAIDAYDQGVAASDLGLLVTVLAGAVVVWRWLDVRGRLRLMERSAVADHDARPVSPVPGRGPSTAAEAPPPPYPSERAA